MDTSEREERTRKRQYKKKKKERDNIWRDGGKKITLQTEEKH